MVLVLGIQFLLCNYSFQVLPNTIAMGVSSFKASDAVIRWFSLWFPFTATKKDILKNRNPTRGKFRYKTYTKP